MQGVVLWCFEVAQSICASELGQLAPAYQMQLSLAFHHQGVFVRILLVEDHLELATWVSKALVLGGYQVDHLAQGDHADQALSQGNGYDLIILDLSLPVVDGLSVLAAMRKRQDTTPVLILSAHGATADKVAGLNLGADDYLPKPFEFTELDARIKALLRRHLAVPPQIVCERLVWDTVARSLSIDGKVVALTPRELALFEALMARFGKPIAKEVLFDNMFSQCSDVRSESIEIYVHRLRKKLAGSGVTITTLRGLGYILGSAQHG